MSQEATKSAPPFAGSAGRCAIPDPVLLRSSRVDVIKTETNIMAIIDQINELRAELRFCVFSKKERAAVEAALAVLVSKQDAAEKADAEAFAQGPIRRDADRPR